MSALHILHSRSTPVYSLPVVLAVCLAVILLIIPLFMLIALCLKSRNRHGHGHGHEKMKDVPTDRLTKFRSNPVPNNHIDSQTIVNGTPMPLLDSSKHDLPTIPLTRHSKISLRLSRPLNIPIRFSALQPQLPHPSHASKPPTKSIFKHSSVQSLVSYASTAYTNETPPFSPISAVTATESSSKLTAPEAVYQTNGYGKYRQDAKPGHDLFINVPLEFASNHAVELNSSKRHQVSDARGGEPSSKHEDAEWRHARTETVDGVLAPRDWV